MFLYPFIMSLLIKDELSLDVGSAQRGGSDPGCEPRAIGLQGVPWLTLKSGRLLRAKSLHSIMIQDETIEMKV